MSYTPNVDLSDNKQARQLLGQFLGHNVEEVVGFDDHLDVKVGGYISNPREFAANKGISYEGRNYGEYFEFEVPTDRVRQFQNSQTQKNVQAQPIQETASTAQKAALAGAGLMFGIAGLSVAYGLATR